MISCRWWEFLFDVLSWKVRVPLKIKIFIWFSRPDVIHTEDNLAKRKWKGGSECCLCNAQEIIQHLFFEYPIVRLVWSTVYITFDIKKPMSISHLIEGWIKCFH
jgi:hypothetical protein